MDRRHIAWVYEVLIRMQPSRTLEIGGYSGCSSSAFVAANIPDAHFAEVSPRADFLSVVRGHGTIHQRKGADVLSDGMPFDVVLVDGSHELEAVTEELDQLLANPPRLIIAHDVRSTSVGFPMCEGAAYLEQVLWSVGWLWEVDAEPREGERTDRGLLMATRDPDLIQLVREAKAAIA